MADGGSAWAAHCLLVHYAFGVNDEKGSERIRSKHVRDWGKEMKPILLSLFAAVAAVIVSLALREASLIYMICALVFVSACVFTGACLLARQLHWLRIRNVLLPMGVFLIIAATHLPLRLAFFLYRDQFDRLASEIQAGTSIKTPVWVGPFRIETAGMRDVPYLASNGDGLEIDGFVRDPEGNGFNIWSKISLNDSWAYISED